MFRCSSSSQATYRLRRAFSFYYKAHRALILLLLASKPDPLSLGFGLGPPLRGGFVLLRENVDLDRPFHMVSKSALRPRLFMPMAKKDVIRPLPCSSFPTAPRCAGLAVGGPPCGRHFSRLRNCIFTGKFDRLCMETPVRQHKKRPGHLQIGRDRDVFS